MGFESAPIGNRPSALTASSVLYIIFCQHNLDVANLNMKLIYTFNFSTNIM